VVFDIAYTPQVNRVYPSVVYSGHDICFDVFTDASSNGGRSILKKDLSKIGDYSIDLSTYETENEEAISNWNTYQICGTAGGNIAAKSSDLTLTAQVGKYLITDFAYSYDGSETYLVRSVPKVNSVSSNTLYKAAGSVLTISGEGFDPTIENNSVKVDDLDCKVFEASTTQLKCVLPAKTTTTTGTEFVGGIGANSVEYDGLVNSEIASAINPSPIYKHFTDIESRRNVYNGKMTRTIQAWFVPPQTGDYVFHASCDNHCIVYLSTTDMDSSSATAIISNSGWNAWRNYWKPSSSIYSSSISLTVGKHYYLKVVHDDWGSSDYMTVGFTFKDISSPRPNSYKGWKKLSIDPKHTFESFTITLPNNTEAEYRLQFKNSGLS
jgi:hypothetical protein